MTSWTEILKANKGLHARDSFSELWGLKLKAAREEFPDYTITGTLPLTFNARVAGALKNYRLYGTSAGSGTPTESGEPAGYKIPILNTSGVTENLCNVEDVELQTLPNSTRYGLQYTTPGYYCIKALEAAKDDRAFLYASVVNQNQETIQTVNVAIPNNRVTANIALESGCILYFYDAYGSATKSETQQQLIDTKIVVLFDELSAPTAPDHYIPHRYTSNYDLFIGDSKLGAEEYVDYQEQKVYKRTENLFDKNDSRMRIRQGSYESEGYTTRYPHVASTGVFQFSAGDYISIISQSASYLRFIKEIDVNGKSIRALNFSGNVLLIDSDGLYVVQINKTNIEAITIEDIEYLNNSFVLELSSTAPSAYIPYLQPTDPPVPLPEITAYKGENTLSSTETVGEVSVTGKITEMA